jgi:hypothetical protein
MEAEDEQQAKEKGLERTRLRNAAKKQARPARGRHSPSTSPFQSASCIVMMKIVKISFISYRRDKTDFHNLHHYDSES